MNKIKCVKTLCNSFKLHTNTNYKLRCLDEYHDIIHPSCEICGCKNHHTNECLRYKINEEHVYPGHITKIPPIPIPINIPLQPYNTTWPRPPNTIWPWQPPYIWLPTKYSPKTIYITK